MVVVYFGGRVASPWPAAPRLPVGAWIPGSPRVGNLNPPFRISLGFLNSDDLTTEQQRGLTWLSCSPRQRTPLVPKLLGIGTSISDCVRPAWAHFLTACKAVSSISIGHFCSRIRSRSM